MQVRESREHDSSPSHGGRSLPVAAATDPLGWMERAERAKNQRERVERARAVSRDRGGQGGALFTPLRGQGRSSPVPSSLGSAAGAGGGTTPLPAVTPRGYWPSPPAKWNGTHWFMSDQYVGRTRAKSGQHANAAYRV